MKKTTIQNLLLIGNLSSFQACFSIARTKISEDVKHTFAWTIERFSERQEPNSQFLWSSKFTIRGPDEQVNTHSNLMLPFSSLLQCVQLSGDSLEDETLS